jgi:hypothetical protein
MPRSSGFVATKVASPFSERLLQPSIPCLDVEARFARVQRLLSAVAESSWLVVAEARIIMSSFNCFLKIAYVLTLGSTIALLARPAPVQAQRAPIAPGLPQSNAFMQPSIVQAQQMLNLGSMGFGFGFGGGFGASFAGFGGALGFGMAGSFGGTFAGFGGFGGAFAGFGGGLMGFGGNFAGFGGNIAGIGGFGGFGGGPLPFGGFNGIGGFAGKGFGGFNGHKAL